jgi:hypothetical protein
VNAILWLTRTVSPNERYPNWQAACLFSNVRNFQPVESVDLVKRRLISLKNLHKKQPVKNQNGYNPFMNNTSAKAGVIYTDY